MTKLEFPRRVFLKHTVAAAASTCLAVQASATAVAGEAAADWQARLTDPVYDMLSGPPNLDRILNLFPRTTGKPAFDTQLIAENVRRLQPVRRSIRAIRTWTCRSRRDWLTSTRRFRATIPNTAWAPMHRTYMTVFRPRSSLPSTALSPGA